MRFGGLGLGSFCWGGFGGRGREPFEVSHREFVLSLDFLEEELLMFDAGKSADVADVEGFGQAFDADLPLGLEAAEFVSGAEKLALG